MKRLGYPPRQAKVTVCEWEDGRIGTRYWEKARPHRETTPGACRPYCGHCLRFALKIGPDGPRGAPLRAAARGIGIS